MIRPILGCALLCIFAMATLGCGGGSGPKLYKIKGTVKYKGKPIPGLMIMFVPDDKSTKAQATGGTNKEGQFEMKVSFENPGVFPGDHTIYLWDPLIDVGSKTSTDPDYLAVVKKYGPGKSPLKVKVEKDDSNYNLDLD